MSWRLRSYEVNPPGGFLYEQDGMKFSEPMIEALAQKLASFRRANGKPRASVQEALADVDYAQCVRLGFMPTYCVNTNSNAPSSSVAALALPPECKGCGVRIQ